MTRDDLIADLAMQNTCLGASDGGCKHRYCALILSARALLGSPVGRTEAIIQQAQRVVAVKGLASVLEAER